MLEQCDPLLVCVQSPVQDDELGDRDAADVLCQTFALADESDALVGDLSGEGNYSGGSVRLLPHILNVQGALAELEFNGEIGERNVLVLRFQLAVDNRDLHVVG